MSGFVTSKNLLDRYKDFREQNDSRYIRLKNSSSSSVNGGVITLGDGLEMNGDTLNATFTISGSGSIYPLQPATKDSLGGIIVGDGLEVEDDGTLSVTFTGGSGSTYSTFTGATSTSNGTRGLVPAPSIGYQNRFLCGNGKWETIGGSTTINGGESNIIEAISIDGETQSIVGKTAILGLSAYAKKTEVGSGVRMKGSVNYFSSLPKDALVGDLYNIKYVNTGDVDGNGVQIKAGDNVVFTTDGKWDVMSGFVDLSNYVMKDGNKVLSTNDFTNAYKDKLNGLKNYTLPAATYESLGGIIPGAGLSMVGDTLNAEVSNVFVGATETKEGKIGTVPTPHVGDMGKFLRGDGYWASIPEENINLVVGGSGSGAVVLDAFSYPPNEQGALWMDVVQDVYCLKLRRGDYEYIFKPDKYTPADIEPPPPASSINGEIYYLNTVPSTVTGGLWYSLNSANQPTLWVHKEGTAYSFDFGYSYDLIAYKGTQENLFSYFVIGEQKMIDIKKRSWSYNYSPVIEKTDFGVYALRNVNSHSNKTLINYSYSLATLTNNTQLSTFTIDFWLSWNADNSGESLAVVTEGNKLAPILTVRGETNGSTNSKLEEISVRNTSLCHYRGTGVTPTYATIQGMESILETPEAKRIHIAITHQNGGKMKVYINGGYSHYSPYSSTRLSYIQLFHYNVGSDVKVRGLYIDHFRIWDKVVWTSDFEPPKPEDYL